MASSVKFSAVRCPNSDVNEEATVVASISCEINAVGREHGNSTRGAIPDISRNKLQSGCKRKNVNCVNESIKKKRNELNPVNASGKLGERRMKRFWNSARITRRRGLREMPMERLALRIGNCLLLHKLFNDILSSHVCTFWLIVCTSPLGAC